jgi:hypothetical protein
MSSRDTGRIHNLRETPPSRSLFDRTTAARLRSQELPGDTRRPHRDIDRSVRDMRELNATERVILHAVGQFRTIALSDLRYVDPAQKGSAERVVRTMKELGLLRSHWIRPHAIREVRNKQKLPKATGLKVKAAVDSPKLHVLTLTRTGVAWLRSNGYDESMQGKLHPGLTKPREAFHDSHLYAMTQNEIQQLRANGSSPIAIHTDSALKAQFQREFQRLTAAGLARAEAHQMAAQSFRLPIVDGKVMLPDVRVEFVQPNGQQSYTDLELISDTYRKSQVAAKGAAGFKAYNVDQNGGFSPGGGGTPWDPDFLARFLGR